MLAYWVVGFALQVGGVGALSTLGGYDQLNRLFTVHLFGHDWGLFGMRGFFLTGVAYNASVFAYFLFQMVFMDTAATIPTGAHGRAVEVLRLLHLQPLRRRHHLPGLRQLGAGAAAGSPRSAPTSASATATSTSPAPAWCT